MNLLINKYEYFLFDLDDTLYPEIKYLDEAYRNIGKFLEKKTKIEPKSVYNFLMSNFIENGRINLFNNMFSFFDIDIKYLESVLNIMRTYQSQNKIFLYKNIYKSLPFIINNSKLVFVVTNGNVIQQNNKVKNIEWKSLEKKIVFVYANEHKKKPSSKSFCFIKEKYKIEEEFTLMIGDSIVDKEYAENCKIDFMHIKEFNALNN